MYKRTWERTWERAYTDTWDNEEQVEIMKCYNPNNELPICRECLRNKKSENNEYEMYDLKKTLMHGWKCNGFENEKER